MKFLHEGQLLDKLPKAVRDPETSFWIFDFNTQPVEVQERCGYFAVDNDYVIEPVKVPFYKKFKNHLVIAVTVGLTVAADRLLVVLGI